MKPRRSRIGAAGALHHVMVMGIERSKVIAERLAEVPLEDTTPNGHQGRIKALWCPLLFDRKELPLERFFSFSADQHASLLF
jgi:hypothetical protein